MTDMNMPLWFDWLTDDEWWEQLGDMPEGDDPKSWCARAVDEAIDEEEDDDYTIDPYYNRGEWSADDFEPF